MHDAFNLVVLGLLYGSTVCCLTCLPYFGPYLIGVGNGFIDGLASVLFFTLGKLCCYTALGGIAALLGQVFIEKRSHNVIMGITLLCVAVTLPLVNKGGCHKRCQVIGKRGSLFVLGVVSSLLPCPPLVAIFLLAANKGMVISGMSYGFYYGLGLMLSPMIIVGGGFGMISEKMNAEAKRFVPYLQGVAMLIMVLMGTNMIMAV